MKLPSLIGLRWLAALWVLGYHLCRGTLENAEGPLRNVVVGAPFAVTMFLVLSGFVITWVYAKPDFAPRAVLRSRFARVAPLYLLAVVLVVPLGIAARSRGMSDDGYASLFFVLTATQAWVPDAALRWNPALWTISVEIFFYALFALTATYIARARMLLPAVIAWCASVAIGVLYVALDPDGLGAVDVESKGTWLFVIRFNPILRLPDFLIGVAAARAFATGWRVPAWAAGLAVIGLVLALASGQVPIVLLHGSLFAPIAAVVIVALAGGVTLFDRLTFLGETSYALYALHLPVWFWACALTKRDPLDVDLVFTPLVAFAAIGVSIGAHLFVEKPLRERLVKKHLR